MIRFANTSQGSQCDIKLKRRLYNGYEYQKVTFIGVTDGPSIKNRIHTQVGFESAIFTLSDWCSLPNEPRRVTTNRYLNLTNNKKGYIKKMDIECCFIVVFSLVFPTCIKYIQNFGI